MATPIKVVLLGNSYVGKTSLMHQWVQDSRLYTPSPTISAAFEQTEIELDEQRYRLTIVDTAGQEMYRSLVPMSIRQANVAAVVFDITSQESFTALSEWIKFAKSAEDAEIVVVGNKCDLDANRAVTASCALEFAEREGAQFCETSAVTGDGCDIAFRMIVVAAVDKQKKANQGAPPVPVAIKPLDAGNQAVCC